MRALSRSHLCRKEELGEAISKPTQNNELKMYEMPVSNIRLYLKHK